MATKGEKSTRKRPWRNFFNLKVIGLVLLVIILWRIDLRGLGGVLLEVRWAPVFGALLLQLIVLLVKAFRWSLLLRTQDVNINIFRAFRYYVVSGYFGIVTPGRVGEMWKALALQREDGVRLAHSLPPTLLDRMMDTYAYVGLGVVSVFYLGIAVDVGSMLVIAVIVIVSPVLLFSQRVVRRIGAWLFNNKLARRFDVPGDIFIQTCLNLISPLLIPAAVITLCGALALAAQFWLLTLALGIDLPEPMIYSLMLSSVLKLVTNVPISVAGIGTRDLALISIFGVLGLPAESAVALSLLLLLAGQLSVAVFGAVICFFQSSLRTSEGKDAIDTAIRKR